MSDYIPEDNLWLILRCLPAKSLLRFRCVCKGWKDIIDSPIFVQEHLSLQNPNFIFQNESSSEIYALHHALPSLSLLSKDDLVGDPIFDPRHFIFLATHNGVVCVCDSSSNHMFGLPSHGFIILWNPSIGKHLTVQIPHCWDCGWFYEAGESCFGFWIDPFTKECKFMEEEYVDADPIGMKGIVYSSVRRDWREIPGVELGSWQSYPTVIIKGVAHWRGTRSADNAGYILSFDFIHERFDPGEELDQQTMPVLDGTNEFIHLHWQGNLSVVVKDQRYPACDNYLLYMRQEGSWVKMFDFNLLS